VTRAEGRVVLVHNLFTKLDLDMLFARTLHGGQIPITSPPPSARAMTCSGEESVRSSPQYQQ
jgi:hypothetical protein